MKKQFPHCKVNETKISAYLNQYKVSMNRELLEKTLCQCKNPLYIISLLGETRVLQTR